MVNCPSLIIIHTYIHTYIHGYIHTHTYNVCNIVILTGTCGRSISGLGPAESLPK